MTSKNGSVRAVVPTEEDVRAARFYMQVTEEARKAAIPREDHLRISYGTAAHKAYFKRGAAVLLRYNLVLSPVFDATEEATIRAYEDMYTKVISGPLVRFKKSGGRQGRFAGLVLLDKPAGPELSAAALPGGMTITDKLIAYEIYHSALTNKSVFLEARAARVLEGWLRDSGIGRGYVVVSALAYDLTVDRAGRARAIAGRLMESEGYGLASGVERYGDHEIYLTKGGRGRVFYHDEEPDREW